MRVSRIKLEHFKRFSDLEIKDIPKSSRLVVLAGPNGCGKSSLFDAINLRFQLSTGKGWNSDLRYYVKAGPDGADDVANHIKVEFHDGKSMMKGAVYIRSAYRNDPEFTLSAIGQVQPLTDEVRIRRTIEQDATVTQNYQRVVAKAFQDVFDKEDGKTTIDEFRESVLGDIRDAVKRLFPDLILNSLGNPIHEGTFRFDKGATKQFDYKNLSGGEKAAFDLILDLIVKRPAYPEGIFCVDEPETHMNTRLQGSLLREMYDLVPQDGQLWIATHSIGMMRKAQELANKNPGSVAFLNFDAHDFDRSVTITPSAPNRAFWESILSVALDDLASLVAPREVVVCEGNPAGAVPGKNAEHDATCYNNIFDADFPDVKFLAGGNAKDVVADRLGFLAAIPMVAKGIGVRRLIDRDDHAPADVTKMESQGITILGRRHLEAYLYDDEVLEALCVSVGKPELLNDLLADKQLALNASVGRGNPADDVKSAAGVIYVKAKQRLSLIGVGNDSSAFARNTLAPLIRPGLKVYAALKKDIFGI